MHRTNGTAIMVTMVMAMGFAAAVQPVSADVEAECRQEAEDYGIVTELQSDYINGCILSRGGASNSSSAEQDYVPPSESDDMTNPGAGSESVTE